MKLAVLLEHGSLAAPRHTSYFSGKTLKLAARRQKPAGAHSGHDSDHDARAQQLPGMRVMQPTQARCAQTRA